MLGGTHFGSGEQGPGDVRGSRGQVLIFRSAMLLLVGHVHDPQDANVCANVCAWCLQVDRRALTGAATSAANGAVAPAALLTSISAAEVRLPHLPACRARTCGCP